MVPYQKAPVPQTRSNHQTEAGTLTIRITTSCNKVLILRTRYLWTKSDIIVHSVVFYEEVGSFSLCCRGCFRGCSYSLLYYYEVCRFNPSQQPLILESADLGLHSGNFDSYSFHLKINRKKCLKGKKIIFQILPILQKLCRFNPYTPHSSL